MKQENKFYSLEISDTDGSILSLTDGKKQFVETVIPLAAILLREKDGSEAYLDTGMAKLNSISVQDNKITISYDFKIGLRLTVSVVAEEEICWYCSIENHTDAAVEWIRCPQISVPDDLVGAGGQSRILWGFNEGAVIEDMDFREGGFKYSEPGYPGRGVMPVFPAIVQMQCMAHYDGESGLYIGTHDSEGNLKSFDFKKSGNGIELDIRCFAGGEFGGDYQREYPVVMKMFSGDWYDAADIYREWFDKNRSEAFVKINENDSLPEWYSDSPVIITYPVRGRHDTDIMNPNKLFPYINVMEHVERLAGMLDSKIMVLLMHWEGTAPWAPPYVWPPYGGEECLRELMDALHKEGHLLGVYCSGLGWTETSNVTDYCRSEDYNRLGLEASMCVSPEGRVEKSWICTSQRSGYDFCPTSEACGSILEKELGSMVDAGIDYVQLFDQNHGGTSYFCYGREHGHPPVPGRWQTEAVRELLEGFNRIAGKRKVLLGCESAAAETYIPGILFSDNRYNLCYNIGRPVPMYGYLYHEYVNNFSGNQVCTDWFIDFSKSPDSMYMRLAHSFIAGDMLTLVLNEDGRVMPTWSYKKSDDISLGDDIIGFVGRLNYWRRKYPQYLLSGRMVKGFTVKTSTHTLFHNRDYSDVHDDVYSSAWTDGRKTAIFLVNYTAKDAGCVVELGKSTSYSIVSRTDIGHGEGDKVILKVPAYSALMIEL